MSMLNSNVEALAFNYASFGFFTVVNNLWTWVAVVTAAVSFWKIRARTAATACFLSDVQHAQQSCNDQTSKGCNSSMEISQSLTPEKALTTPAKSKASVSTSGNDNVMSGSTKGKFTLYYEDECCGVSKEEEATLAKEWEDDDDCEGLWLTWEELLRKRIGEMGWYSSQDLSVINGNVVRFWDDSCVRSRYSSSCAVF